VVKTSIETGFVAELFVGVSCSLGCPVCWGVLFVGVSCSLGCPAPDYGGSRWRNAVSIHVIRQRRVRCTGRQLETWIFLED